MSIFETIDFGMLQSMLYPVIKAMGGPDVQDFVAGKAEAFQEASDLLAELSGLMGTAAEALGDGILTNDEINQIIADAGEIQEAFEALMNAVDGKLIEGNS